MITHNLAFCDLTLKETYAILVMNEGVTMSIDVVQQIRDCLKSHYKNRDFILITDRRNEYTIDLSIYRKKTLKNMKGIAVVSQNPKEVERAIQEQALWEHSFTFFKEIEEAEDWAQTFFRN